VAELNLIEKVIALEGVELFAGLSPEQLSRIALIAQETEVPAGRQILPAPASQGPAMYVILDGAVEVSRDGQALVVARQNEVLGSWALFDAEPLAVEAKTIEAVKLLRIDRDDFYDLLSDHGEITAAIFAALVKRFRKLVEA
jgi:CRP-like cAMP-binding protein